MGLKQIKTKISSVKNIKKITKALEVVSTIKLQQIKKKTEHYRDFLIEFLKIAQVIHTKINLFWYDETQVNQKKQQQRNLLIVLGTDKWLCGSINSRLFKHIFKKYVDQRENTDIFCVGKKALDFFWRYWFTVVWSISLKDNFSSDDLRILHTFVWQEIQKRTYATISVCFNYFQNPITQSPVILQLFPFTQSTLDAFTEQVGNVDLDQYLSPSLTHKDILVEPSLAVVRDEFMQQFVEHLIYGAVLQNKAWEFASRMLAMKNAKDNASAIINTLTLAYNKARQGIITQEISEIVSAKTALEK